MLSALLAFNARQPDRVTLWDTRTWSTISPPDSFALVINAGFAGDSIWMHDAASKRLLFYRDGRWSQRYLPTLAAGYSESVLGILEDGSVAVVSWSPSRSGLPDVAIVWLQTMDGPRILDSLESTPLDLTLSGPKVTLRRAQPWRVHDAAILAHDRKGLVVLKQFRSYYSENDGDDVNLVITKHRAPHFESENRVLSLPRIALKEDEIDRWKQLLLSDTVLNALGGRENANRELATALFTPSRLSVVDRAAELSSGALLVERPLRGGRRLFEAWSLQGHTATSLALSDSWEFHALTGDSLIWIGRGSVGTPDTVVIAVLRTDQ